jgi:hypothetical protein
MDSVALCASVRIEQANSPPEWLHLIPTGEAITNDGRGPYRILDPQSVITASMAHGKLPLDENHATDLAAPNGGAAPARGWIEELQHRADGIWGRVTWTAEAVRTGLHHAYRGVSPVIVHLKDGTITKILRASLTNTPNFQGLKSLHSVDRLGLADLTVAERHVVDLLGLDPALFLNRRTEERDGAVARQSSSSCPNQEGLRPSDLEVIQALGLDPQAYTDTKSQTTEKALHQMDPIAFRMTLIKVLDLPEASDDPMIIAKVKELVKRYTGKDVAMMSVEGQARDLATGATLYQAKMAAEGITIDYATAVRAVKNGRTF